MFKRAMFVGFCSAVLVSVAQVEALTVTLSGTVTQAGTIRFSTNCIPDNCICGIAAPSEIDSVEVTVGQDARSVRDSWINMIGEITNAQGGAVVKARTSANGLPGATVILQPGCGDGSPIPVQLFVDSGDGQYILLEPGAAVTFRGITFQVCGTDACHAATAGGVPAITAWGLLTLVMLMLVSGTWLMIREKRAGVCGT